VGVLFYRMSGTSSSSNNVLYSISDTDRLLDIVERMDEPDGVSKPIVWDDDAESFELSLWEMQSEVLSRFWNDEDKIVGNRCGFRGGKTMGGAAATLLSAWKWDDTDYLVLAESRREGLDSTYKVLFELLPSPEGEKTVPSIADGYGDPTNSYIVAGFSKQNMKLTLTNGSTITFGYASDAWAYKGSEFSGIWVDEIAMYSAVDTYDLVRMLVSRVNSANRGPRSLILTTTTNGYNAFYDIVGRGVLEDGEDVAWEIADVRYSTLENPYLTRQQKKDEVKNQKGMEVAGLHGGFAAASGRVFGSFSRDSHVIPESEAEERVTDNFRLYGYDAGWDDPRVVIEVGRTPEGQLIVLDEFYKSESMIEDARDWAKNKPSGRIYAEHEPEHIAKLRDAGLTVMPADKSSGSVAYGIEVLQKRLETDSEGRVGMLISDKCEETVKEILSYTEDEVQTSRAKDHAIDSLRYAIATEYDSIEESDGSSVSVSTVDKSGNKSTVTVEDDSDGDGGEPVLSDDEEELSEEEKREIEANEYISDVVSGNEDNSWFS